MNDGKRLILAIVTIAFAENQLPINTFLLMSLFVGFSEVFDFAHWVEDQLGEQFDATTVFVDELVLQQLGRGGTQLGVYLQAARDEVVELGRPFLWLFERLGRLVFHCPHRHEGF